MHFLNKETDEMPVWFNPFSFNSFRGCKIALKTPFIYYFCTQFSALCRKKNKDDTPQWCLIKSINIPDFL